MSDLEDLKTRLKIAKSKLQNGDHKKPDKKGVYLGNAFKLGTELVAAVAVGTIIGFILDNWFGTKPILIIVFFLFGAVAGIVNVFRAAKKMQKNGNQIMAANPMQQFEVHRIGPEIEISGINLSFTN